MGESLYSWCRRMGQDALLAQWAAENQPLTPEAVLRGSKRRVWWRCEQGHLWQAMVYTRAAGAGCPYCAGRKVLPGFNDLATRRPDLAAQWHPEKNGALTPAQVQPGSHRQVWWQCGKGHVWRAGVHTRAGGSGCPVCAGRRLLPARNDLETLYPALAAQWHPEKNGELTPAQVLPGSRRRVWWRCGLGHVWQAEVAARVRGTGCPVCAGKQVVPGFNDLASRFPDIAAQWHPEKNGTLRPQAVSPYANRKVWWRCGQGHAYAASVAARTKGASGCPYCAGRKVLPGFNDLATRAPELAAQWHPTLNGALTPAQVPPGSHQKVWWCCSAGHVWKAAVYARAGRQQSGCPVCAGKVRRRGPDSLGLAAG